MSGESEERLAEWAVWFHENKRRIPVDNLKAQNLFLLKAVDGCLEMLARTLKDVQILEERNPLNKLWLPQGVDIKGDVTKFG